VDLVGLKPDPYDHYFLQCFDTVGWVIWPVKPVPDMTYNVFSGTLNPTQSINNVSAFADIHISHNTELDDENKFI